MLTYYTPIPAEQRLIDALRSGEFKQGRNALESGGTNCCLGVACRVSDAPLIVIIEDGRDTRFDNRTATLPWPVVEELGWEDDCGCLRIRNRAGYQESLTNLNDRGYTFNQIADLIEWGAVLRAGEVCE